MKVNDFVTYTKNTEYGSRALFNVRRVVSVDFHVVTLDNGEVFDSVSNTLDNDKNITVYRVSPTDDEFIENVRIELADRFRSLSMMIEDIPLRFVMPNLDSLYDQVENLEAFERAA